MCSGPIVIAIGGMWLIRRNAKERGGEKRAWSRTVRTAAVVFLVLWSAGSALIVMGPRAPYAKRSQRAFLWGFRERMEATADVEAIRAWAGELDLSENPSRRYGSLAEDTWPAAVKALDPEPHSVYFGWGREDAVSLLYGGHWIGNYTLVVGPEEMGMRERKARGEWRFRVSAGAYVTYRMAD